MPIVDINTDIKLLISTMRNIDINIVDIKVLTQIIVSQIYCNGRCGNDSAGRDGSKLRRLTTELSGSGRPGMLVLTPRDGLDLRVVCLGCEHGEPLDYYWQLESLCPANSVWNFIMDKDVKTEINDPILSMDPGVFRQIRNATESYQIRLTG
jgi:hypothetical protein